MFIEILVTLGVLYLLTALMVFLINTVAIKDEIINRKYYEPLYEPRRLVEAYERRLRSLIWPVLLLGTRSEVEYARELIKNKRS